jgi:hypothetical protein
MADKHAGGRPTKYDDKYCDMIVEYFDKPAITYITKKEFDRNGEVKSETQIPQGVEFPTFQGFANSIDVNMDTLNQWGKDYSEFSEAYARAKAIQESIWLTNGMSGLYNSQFAQFFGKNCLGYKDKIETDLNIGGQKDNPLNISTLSDAELAQELAKAAAALAVKNPDNA